MHVFNHIRLILFHYLLANALTCIIWIFLEDLNFVFAILTILCQVIVLTEHLTNIQFSSVAFHISLFCVL